uniref:Dihydrolipoamide acetyltransferase component of pyruvate dehydrogenase complex n=1 Tax=Candidatus Aschnera chinzeii TaxID=1485666 RepID=A0AAT9G4Z7_9ENTR|nr:MAG: pyruvate dehydrogenase complex dihydrolipoyllysine-residue acetyltransferase [Candidatus Aschnera chinzeii]
MYVDIHIPDIGNESLEVIDILVKIGDAIKIDQSLITVEGEKVSLDIPSTETGIVKNIHVAIGDKVTTGTLIMIIQKTKSLVQPVTENKIDLNSTISNKDLSTEEIKHIISPNIGNNTIEVIAILVRKGDLIVKNDSIIQLKGDNIIIEIITPYDGIVKDIKIHIGDVITSNSLLMSVAMKINNSMNNNVHINYTDKTNNMYSINNDKSVTNIQADITKLTKDIHCIHATPSVRRLAREFGVNLSNIKGTGIKNRILRNDIILYIKDIIYDTEFNRHNKSDSTCLSKNINKLSNVDYNLSANHEKIILSNIQKKISANVSHSWSTVPHVTIMDDIDITEAESFRKEQNNIIKNIHLNTKITILVFVMKAVAYALTEMPYFNSSLSDDANTIILKKHINIGIAIDTVKGLVVPVIRNVNNKGILQLSKELITITKKARAGKLDIADVQNGTFTISNLGNIGIVNFTPIINFPEVAIIGLSRASIKPIWYKNQIVSRLILPISLSFDHRVINGADGARFITKISELMSDIRRLIM